MPRRNSFEIQDLTQYTQLLLGCLAKCNNSIVQEVLSPRGNTNLYRRRMGPVGICVGLDFMEQHNDKSVTQCSTSTFDHT